MLIDCVYCTSSSVIYHNFRQYCSRPIDYHSISSNHRHDFCIFMSPYIVHNPYFFLINFSTKVIANYPWLRSNRDLTTTSGSSSNICVTAQIDRNFHPNICKSGNVRGEKNERDRRLVTRPRFIENRLYICVCTVYTHDKSFTTELRAMTHIYSIKPDCIHNICFANKICNAI